MKLRPIEPVPPAVHTNITRFLPLSTRPITKNKPLAKVDSENKQEPLIVCLLAQSLALSVLFVLLTLLSQSTIQINYVANKGLQVLRKIREPTRSNHAREGKNRCKFVLVGDTPQIKLPC